MIYLKNFLFILFGFSFAVMSVVVSAQVIEQPVTIPSFYPVSATSTMTIADQEKAVYEAKQIQRLVDEQILTNWYLDRILKKI